ncbi:MAG: DUF4270 family protein [Pedobacter sp.]|nr:MAG: DUF4270 family protein [Pedobacter sp.]
MKFIKLDLLTLLIGLFLLSSCKDANTIGLELDPTLAVKGTLNNSLTVKSVTEKDAAANTLSQSRHPLGFINGDPIFGNTESALSMAVSLQAEGYSFGQDPVLDSAVLILPYQRTVSDVNSTFINEFYGDTATSVYGFKVYQLKDNISLQTNFSSDREFATETTVLGSFSAKISPNTPVKVTNIVAGKADTVATVAPHIRIRLDRNFIQNNIVNLDSVTRARSTRFNAAFKGLQIRVDKATSSGKGGMIFTDFTGSGAEANSNASVRLYYRKNTLGSVIDTLAVNFPVAITSGPVAATIKHDYTGTPVKTQLDAPAGNYNVTYLQGLAGLRTKISFPDLANFAATVKGNNPDSKVVINRAELVVNVESGTDVAPYTPALRLALYRNDIAGQRAILTEYIIPTSSQPNPKYAGSSQLVNGFYDKTNKRYMFIVTSYLQDLIDGTTEDYGTYLAVTGFDQSALTPSVVSAARSVISTNSTGGAKPIQLNIYYTKVN